MPGIDRIRRACPFPWIAMHTDNGSEFLNHFAVNWCRTHNIRQTRGRPGKSDDQAYAENANRHYVRRLVGDFRYEGPEALDVLNDLYRVTGDLANFFKARLRRVDDSGDPSNRRAAARRYDKPKTPFVRLLESDVLARQTELGLDARASRLNPFKLRRQRDELLEKLWKLGRSTR